MSNTPGDICQECLENNRNLRRRLADESDWNKLESYKRANAVYNTKVFADWVASVCWAHSPYNTEGSNDDDQATENFDRRSYESGYNDAIDRIIGVIEKIRSEA